VTSAELTTVTPNLPAVRPVRLLPQLTDREFLPAAIEIVETPPSPARTAMMFIICALAAAVLAWCWFGRIDIYATARGKIEPAGHAKVVQPLDPGKVAAIKVHEGQSVREGDVILVLDASEAEAEIAADAQARNAKLAEALRREAALSAVARNSLAIPPAVSWPEDVPQSTRLREEDVLSGDLLNERVAMRQVLIDKSVGTRTSLLDAVQVLRQEQSQIAGDIGKRDQALAAVASLNTERARTVEAFVADNTRKMADARRVADEKEADRVKAQVKLDRSVLRSPVDGVVQALAVTTLGQVVTPGQQLMRIVPSNAPVEVQAFVTNEDIGFVRPGQAAVLKIDSFPFTRYGTVDATVQEVASDAIPAETANRTLSDATKESDSAARNLSPTAPPVTDLVFETKLKPSLSALTVNDREIALSPGMTVTVEIKTGSRRILEYLFSPLVEVAGKAMRER
jgi:hemolysin D